MSKKIVAVTANILDYLIKDLKFDSNKISLLPISSPYSIKKNIYKDLFVNKKDLNRIEKEKKNGKSIVTFYGRIEVIKGAVNFVQACNEILKSRDDIFILIIGNGSMIESCKAFLSNNSDAVFFTGKLRNPYPYLELSDVVCSLVPLDRDIKREMIYGGMGQTQLEVLSMNGVLISHYSFYETDSVKFLPGRFVSYNPAQDKLSDLIVACLGKGMQQEIGEHQR